MSQEPLPNPEATLAHYQAQAGMAQLLREKDEEIARWRNLAERLQAQADEMRSACQWISVEERLPESGRTVLAFYLNSHGKGRCIRAMFVKRWTVEAEEFADPDVQCCEYSEQDDCYYTTEGWYELIDNWPDYASCAVIEGVITHWMPLPAAPTPTNGDSHD